MQSQTEFPAAAEATAS